MPDGEKSAALCGYEAHLSGVKKERDFLRSTVENAEAQITQLLLRGEHKRVCSLCSELKGAFLELKKILSAIFLHLLMIKKYQRN